MDNEKLKMDNFATATEQSRSLPKGWEIKKLGEICEFQNGKAHEKIIYKNGKYILINSKFISSNGQKYKRINEQLKPLFIGDIVFVMSDVPNGKALAKCFLVDQDDLYSLNQRICVIRTNRYDKKFLHYHLNRHKYLLSFNNGENQTNLRKNDILKCPLVFPPLPEQKRIVSILDRAFKAIDKAKANAEQNLINAAALFESYLQGVFDPSTRSGRGNIGDDWVESLLNEITEVKDGTHDSPKYIKEGIPFVTQKNIKPDGFTIENTKFITEVDHQKFYKRSNVTFGDIIISMIGANRGMAAIVNIKDTFSIKNVGLIKESENINQHFLLYYLQSSLAMKYVKSMSNGGAQEFIGLRALRAFPIPFPKPKEEQKEIVQKLNSLSAETKKLESIYQQKIDDLEELKKSILQKAFNGELTKK